LFQAAADRAPALIILEDLDRTFGTAATENRTGITIQHLLNCLDGPATQSGITVVATANDPTTLDAAILKRPVRFDRLVPFPVPSMELRREYLRRLTNGTLDEDSLVLVAREADRLSFAQIREAYILAGQRAFRRTQDVQTEEVLTAIRTVRGEVNGLATWADGRSLGFGRQAL